MKRYHLDVITGSDFCVDYEVEADGFDYNNGCYVFKIEQKHTHMKTIVASYPINRTIITKIEEI
jgi:hypothetical protein